MDKMDKLALNLDETMKWVEEAPEEVWKVIFPELEDKLKAEVKSGEFLNKIREDIIKQNLTINELTDQLANLKKSVDNFIGGKNTYKQQYLQLLYQVLEEAYEIIIEEGFSPRIKVPIELEEDAIIPIYANKGDAGADICLQEDIVFPGQKTILLKTGLKVALPDGWELQVRPKSGLSLNTPLRIANSPGTIDSGYRDEIGIIITNTNSEGYQMKKGSKIAQLVLTPIYKARFEKVDNVSEIGENRGGGFGSTGA